MLDKFLDFFSVFMDVAEEIFSHKIINLLGVIFIAVTFLTPVDIFIIVIGWKLKDYWLIGLTVLAILNLLSAVFTAKNKTAPAVIFSIPFGALGGIIAAKTTNKNCSGVNVISVTLSIQVWIIIDIIILFTFVRL